MAEPGIQLDGVTKNYGTLCAVDNVSFQVARGEIAGFLGPNGAGKSTVLKMIATWLPPTTGSLRVAGSDTQDEALAVRRNIGYLPEHNALYDGMRVDRFLAFVGSTHGLRKAALRERLDWVVDGCAIEAVLGRPIRECSKGYRQRVGLAAALIHDPRVLILDEPTHGLDPLQVVAFRKFMQQLKRGRAILFSSHILSEVVALSDRLLVIHRGRLLLNQTTEAFAEQAGRHGQSLEDALVALVDDDEPVA